MKELLKAIRNKDTERVVYILRKIPLDNLAQRDYYRILQYLIETTEFELIQQVIDLIRSKQSESLAYDFNKFIYKAIAIGDVKKVKMLIDTSVHLNKQDQFFGSPLIYAVRQDQYNVARTLIRSGADVNRQVKNGNTPLREAITVGRRVCFDLLLQHNADVNLRTTDDQTPVIVAALYKRYDMLRMLINAGADLSPLTHSDSAVIANIACSTDRHADLIEKLAAAGAKVDTRNSFGWTPLGTAAKRGHLAAVKALIAAGADANAKAKDGLTPLIAAAYHGQEKVVDILIKAGVDVNARCLDTALNTALLAALKIGNLAIVRLLVNAGATFNYTMADKLSAIQVAAKEGDIELLDCIIARNTNVVRQQL